MQAPRSLTLVCDGTVQKVSATVLHAKWVQAVTPPGNNGSVNGINIGFTEVTAPTASPLSNGTGFPIPAGWAGQMLPPIAELTAFYDLSLLRYAGVAGDILYILYGG
jgi:hypothetical protein